MARFQAQYVCFTLNNPTVEEIERLKTNIRGQAIYGIFQKERGEQGTLHLQGYVAIGNRRGQGYWKEFLGARAHLEKARGSAEDNRRYCTKPQDPPFEDGIFEFGTMPTNKQGARSDIGGALSAATGGSVRSLIEGYPDEFVKYSRGLLLARSYLAKRRRHKTVAIWCYGPTGSGKSKWCSEYAPDAYWKSASDKWWSGYDNEDIVVVDDYRTDFCTFHHLLNLLDRYPLTLESKGGHVQFTAHTIIFTSPKSPFEIWSGRTEEDIAQLRRRVEHVVQFPCEYLERIATPECECEICRM